MLFDFERFTKLFARAYPVAVYGRHKQYCGRDCGLYSYDDALAVFKEYFLTYEYYMGTAHPQLKRERIDAALDEMSKKELEYLLELCEEEKARRQAAKNGGACND